MRLEVLISKRGRANRTHPAKQKKEKPSRRPKGEKKNFPVPEKERRSDPP